MLYPRNMTVLIHGQMELFGLGVLAFNLEQPKGIFIALTGWTENARGMKLHKAVMMIHRQYRQLFQSGGGARSLEIVNVRCTTW